MSTCFTADHVGLHVAGTFEHITERPGFKSYFLQKCKFCPMAVGYRGMADDGQMIEHSYGDGEIVLIFDGRTRKVEMEGADAEAFVTAHEKIKALNHKYLFEER